jgi:hypothetical protein
MRNIILIIYCLFSISSFAQDLGRPAVPEQPYVLLYGGKQITADTVYMKATLTKDRIVADKVEYKPKDVEGYSDGIKTFLRYQHGEFATRIHDGKIRLYSDAYASEPAYSQYGFGSRGYNPYTTGTGQNLAQLGSLATIFLQDSATGQTGVYGYKALHKWIPANTPAGAMLHKYKRNRTIIKSLMWAGLGMIFMGTYISGDAVLKDKSDAAINSGLYVMLGGAGVITSSFITIPLNRRNMRKALGIHNGVWAPDEVSRK